MIQQQSTVSEFLYDGMQNDEVRRHKSVVCPFCGHETRGLVVIKKFYGWFIYCHRCSKHRQVRTGNLPLSTIRALLKKRNEPGDETSHVLEKVTLPHDFTTQIPESGLRWLRSYRVTDEEVKLHRFGYSETYDRLILPVFGEDEVIYWQGRRLGDDLAQPKYLNFSQARTQVYFVVNKESNTTIIVEDILSALAVARAGFNAVALLGSNVNDSILASIPSMTKRVKFWLDPDMRKKSVKFSKRLRSKGIKSSSILLPVKDPKEYLPDEIIRIVTGAYEATDESSSNSCI